jgi:hypothetical protein
VRAGTLLALLVTIGGLAAPPARAEDPPLVNWPALLPALAPPFTESTFDLCPDGSPRCLDATLAEMRRRLAAHDAACSDHALFLRNYQMVTLFYQRLAGTGFFQDDAYVAREDAIFARLYFDAEDAWRGGDRERVPEAWRIAFQAADERAVQGAGNLMLGINAHVQRDQPYMIAGLGLVDPQGRSRKPDHDKFNELLNTAYDDVIAQAVEWDDPDLARYEVPGTQADNLALFQIVAGWREGVWRNAERLVRAHSDAERRLVAESIERNAAEWARWIREEFRYRGPFNRASRDALCPKRAQRAAAEQVAPAAPAGAERCDAAPAVRRRGRRILVTSPCGGDLVIARRMRDSRCRFVTRSGRLGAPRRCGRPTVLADVRRFGTRPLPPGAYVVRSGRQRWRLRLR